MTEAQRETLKQIGGAVALIAAGTYEKAESNEEKEIEKMMQMMRDAEKSGEAIPPQVRFTLANLLDKGGHGKSGCGFHTARIPSDA